jgi:hypothetical protein
MTWRSIRCCRYANQTSVFRAAPVRKRLPGIFSQTRSDRSVPATYSHAHILCATGYCGKRSRNQRPMAHPTMPRTITVQQIRFQSRQLVNHLK